MKSARDALLKSVRAHGSKKGMTSAQKLWLAAEKCLPESFVDEMEKISDGRQGRSWLHIDRLLRLLDAKIEESVGHKLNPDVVINASQEQQSASRNLDGLCDSDRHDLLRTHADALQAAALYLNPQFSSKRRLVPLSSVGVCALCWRLAVRCHNSRKFFCQIHRPSARNPEYLNARAAKRFRGAQGQKSEMSLYLYRQRRLLSAAVNASWRPLESRSPERGDLHGAELLALMNHFPLVRSSLSDDDLGSAICILGKLGITVDHSDELMAAAAKEILGDPWAMSDLLILAEAWLQTLAAFKAWKVSGPELLAPVT